MKEKLILISIIGLGLLGLGWIATHGTLKVTASGGTSGTYHYTITDADGQTIVDTDAGDSYSKIVSKGTYQITITSDNTSAVSRATTSRFLGNTTVYPTLQAQALRRFVGTNPDSCMYYTDRLISGPCGGAVSGLKVHVPASTVQPSYTDTIPLSDFNDFGSSTQIVQTANGTLGLTVQPEENDSRLAGYYVFAFRPDFSIASVKALPNLVKTDTYYAKSYKTGMLLYDSTMQAAWYLADANASLQPIHVEGPQNDKLKLGPVTTTTDTMTAVYTDQSVGVDDESRTSSGNSEVVVFKDGSSQHYNFGKLFSIATTCGSNKLCAVSNAGLEIYTLEDGKAHLQATLAGVTNLVYANNRVLAVNSTGLLAYDADSAEGYYAYTFGKYKFCGLTATADDYIICVTDPKGHNEALYGTLATKDALGVDRRVADLFTTDAISDVSVYDNLIFLTPNYGDGTYNWATHTQSYDPTKKQAVDTAIAGAVSKAGLGSTEFKVINIGTL